MTEPPAGESPAASPALEVTGVSKSYGSGTHALADTDLSVAPGEFVSLVGPSGCGKSTLLSMIAGLLPPDTGTIRLDGEDIAGRPAGRRAAGGRAMVFQEPALMPWLSVRKNVEYGLRARGMARAERRERALEALALVHLEGVADQQPHELSGGMRQRAAIARALVMRPRVLLMDEPFSALDVGTRTVLHEELQRIYLETRPAVVFVTHNLMEAAFLADTVYLMSPSPGQIIQRYDVALERPREESDRRLADIRNDMLDRLRANARENPAPAEAMPA